MGKKFDAIFESVIQRYQAGGFLTGDPVRFVSGYKSSDTYKGIPPHMQKDLDELVNSGLNIIVTQVGGKVSPASAGDQFRTPNQTVITVAGDQGGQRHYGFITVTPDMLELQDNGPNLPPVPDQFRKKDVVIIKPEKVVDDPKNITRVTDKGNGKNTPTDLKLATEGTRLKRDNKQLASLYVESVQNPDARKVLVRVAQELAERLSGKGGISDNFEAAEEIYYKLTDAFGNPPFGDLIFRADDGDESAYQQLIQLVSQNQ